MALTRWGVFPTSDLMSPWPSDWSMDPFGALTDPFSMPWGRGGLTSDQLALPRGMEWDVSETANEFRVKADMPGFNKDQIKVTMDNGILRINAEKSVS